MFTLQDYIAFTSSPCMVFEIFKMADSGEECGDKQLIFVATLFEGTNMVLLVIFDPKKRVAKTL